MSDVNIGNGRFLLGDCLERMRELPDASVDMVVTSPPYDNLRTYNDGDAWSFDLFKPIAKEMTRLIKPGSVIVWNVGDATIKGSETGSSFRQALYFKDECGLNIHDTMIYKKANPGGAIGATGRYIPVFEYMFVFSCGVPKYFNPIKDRENKRGGGIEKGKRGRRPDGSRREGTLVKLEPFGKRFNIWTIPTQTEKGVEHPAPFPMAMPHDHIISWSKLGDIVLDPFAGSGTTAIAAERTGRNWICIERDPEYFARATDRVRREVGLFV